MVDFNLQREHILPSERAKAYKMKMDALKRQGMKTDLTSSPLGRKSVENEAAAIIGGASGDSRNNVYRYVRLRAIPYFSRVAPILRCLL